MPVLLENAIAILVYFEGPVRGRENTRMTNYVMSQDNSCVASLYTCSWSQLRSHLRLQNEGLIECSWSVQGDGYLHLSAGHFKVYLLGAEGPSSSLYWVIRMVHFLKQGLSFSKVTVPSRKRFSLCVWFSSPVFFFASLSSSLIKDMLCLPVKFSCRLRVVRF